MPRLLQNHYDCLVTERSHKKLKLAQRNMFEPADAANASAMLVLS